MEMAVACTFSPNGPMLAGRHGLSMLSVAASSAAGFAALPDHWKICAHVAAENGRAVHRDSWRVVVPIHVAPTREQAIAEVSEDIMSNVVTYLRTVGGEPMRQALEGVDTAAKAVERWTTQGFGPLGVLTIGTPDDLAAKIEALLEQSGGYGCFMALAHNAASWDATRRSYELLARHVMPRFQHNDRRRESARFSGENSGEFIGAVVTATTETLEKHKDLLEAARSS
jgi:limonene 1,2-monooxygenase